MLRHSVPHFPPNFGVELSDGTQRYALPRYQNEEVKILNIPRVEIEPTTCHVYTTHHGLISLIYDFKIY